MEERSPSRASGTTYHSFNDTELFEPPSPPRPPVTYDARTLAQLERLQHELQRQQREGDAGKEKRPASATKMQRQDSGYESITPSRHGSTSKAGHGVVRRSSNASSTGGGAGAGTSSRPQTRPPVRRSSKSHPIYNVGRNSNQSLRHVGSNPSTQNTSFFHFPSPDPIQLADSTPNERLAPTPAPTPPPQTTHYWTSDRTRRLEYAAIDAATRGVKGWIMRHLVPDCFVPNRHVSFDDDSGSVRRYRLELEEDNMTDRVEKMAPVDIANENGHGVRRRKGWRFWRRRKNMGMDTSTSMTNMNTF
ncbi:Fc.00g044430.m01.CDS01 [Cosmosporella sp. VM-42]